MMNERLTEEPLSDAPHTPVRKHVRLEGILQGVGCRPTVYRLAVRHGLAGSVRNTTSAVFVEVEGGPEACDAFIQEVGTAIPFPGRVDAIAVEEVPPRGEIGFRIAVSTEDRRLTTPIPPDVAVCPDCVAELLDPHNHRYCYPFITCTLCGPRFTVVRGFPYDRERTSMADFVMCGRCESEYRDPDDRRFHSQTNSCPECGPALYLTDAQGRTIAGDPLPGAIRMLQQGGILAVKGIGGFHLACDASNEEAVALLRERKGRAEKPFAVMVSDLAAARRLAVVDSHEERLLTSPIAPIVLLTKSGVRDLAANVAPGMGSLGVMLPYAPLHYLLFRHPAIPQAERPAVLVMTSGNRSEEPIVRDNAEAIDCLGDLVDGMLCHNREIVLRADDSIYRVIAGRPTVFRRSRGLVPRELVLPRSGRSQSRSDAGDSELSDHVSSPPVVLAAGGDLKSCPAVAHHDRIIPGPHVGDLASPKAQEYFHRSSTVLAEYLDVRPDVVAVDPHPEYFSRALGHDLGLPVEEVFHHHAHAASLLAEHGLEGPALVAVFDGTGYGPDATVWGGEFLLADLCSFTRKACLATFFLPGGEAAVKQPARILASLLETCGTLDPRWLPLIGEPEPVIRLWLDMIRKRFNCPETTSAGRLFDAAAVAAGFRGPVTFEGQAAMWLEGIADPQETGSYPLPIMTGKPLILNCREPVRSMAEDALSGTAPAVLSARFHRSVAEAIAETLRLLAAETGIATTGLTGGCFQNKLLTEHTVENLRRHGLTVLLHGAIPPNDGGIAVGQAAVALNRSASARNVGETA